MIPGFKRISKLLISESVLHVVNLFLSFSLRANHVLSLQYNIDDFSPSHLPTNDKQTGTSGSAAAGRGNVYPVRECSLHHNCLLLIVKRCSSWMHFIYVHLYINTEVQEDWERVLNFCSMPRLVRVTLVSMPEAPFPALHWVPYVLPHRHRCASSISSTENSGSRHACARSRGFCNTKNMISILVCVLCYVCSLLLDELLKHQFGPDNNQRCFFSWSCCYIIKNL